MDGGDHQVQTGLLEDPLCGGEVLRGVAQLHAVAQMDLLPAGGPGLGVLAAGRMPVVVRMEVAVLVHHVVVVGEAEGGQPCVDRRLGHINAGGVAVKGDAGVHVLVGVEHKVPPEKVSDLPPLYTHPPVLVKKSLRLPGGRRQ